MYKDVYFYITPNAPSKTQKKKKKSRCPQNYTLLIDNQSGDSVRIENFSRFVFHMTTSTKVKNALRWEFLTLSNEFPDDVVFAFPNLPLDKLVPEGGEVSDVVIPPNSVFASDVYIQTPMYVIYMGGCYYKLRLYYGVLEEDSTDYKYVAETIVWVD